MVAYLILPVCTLPNILTIMNDHKLASSTAVHMTSCSDKRFYMVVIMICG